MSVEKFLLELRARGVRLSADGGRLRSTGPKGALTPEQQREIVRRKSEILPFLRDANCQVLPPIPKANRQHPLPLSCAQERLWFLHRLQPGNSTYNIAAFRRFEGSVRVPALEASVREVARRHECLRASFIEQHGAPVQVIHPDVSCVVPVTDLTGFSEAEREDRLQALIRERARQPFDLSAAPLFRTSLVRMAVEQYVFVLVVHHMISDGWSVGIFFRESGELYRTICAGQSASLSDLPLQYGDYACWQRKELTTDSLEGEFSYWQQKLEASPRLLELPTDYRRPAVQGSQGTVLRFELPEPVSSALKSLAIEERASQFMMLLAVFKALLYRYTRQTDILVGTPVQTRDRPELEDLIGCFVNTLVLRTQLTGGLTGRELLRRVRETVLEGHAHLRLPFEKLVEALRPERTLSYSPLFQVAFQLQNTPLTSAYETVSASSMFDLSLFMWESGQRFCGALEYSTELFKESTIARMAGHFGVLAAAIGLSPDRPIGSLPLLSPGERVQLLGASNCTTAAHSRELTIHGLFTLQAGHTPHAPAVMAQTSKRQISYGELDARSNRLAHRLRAFGVGAETLVGVCMDRSIDMVTALVGVLKAGGAYVPLDPRLPQERLAFMVKDTGLSLVLTEGRLRGLVARLGCVGLSLDRELAEIGQESNQPPANLVSPHNLAYVIYTSGSTGTPKGVEITHRSVVNFLESMRREPGLTPEDRLLSVTPLSFDIAGLEIYLPLIAGARVMLASRSAASDGTALQRLLANFEATVMQATPATWRMLLESGWKGRKGLKVLCGGEALSQELANRLLALGAEVWNLYGPTETTIWSTLHRVTAGKDVVPIGRPIANTQVYLLDENRAPVPQGVPGELYIGGDGLARGYRNRPELTAEKFIPHPFLVGERLYRTGDLARMLPDGALHFLGRLDHQVKIRGLRIELEEVEHALRSHAEVQEAIATVVGEGLDRTTLACYILPSNGMHPGALIAELRRHLADRLPEYMVPASFTILKSIPLTANGKVNRHALPPPTRMVEESTHPRNFTETQLLSIWQQVLEVQGIGTRDNFFELGGHSLLAVKLLAQLEKVFGPLPVSLLFQAPTVEQMAAKLADSGVVLAWRSLVAIQPRGERPPLFLVPGVRGNVLACTNLALGLGPDQPVYGLQYVGVDGRQRPLSRVEDIAAHFVSEIRTVQKDGPYHIAGHCVGGAIAFEMARQLAAQGCEVGTLFMIDTWPPGSYTPGRLLSRPLIRPAVCLCRCVMWRLRALWRLSLAENAAYAHKVIRALPGVVFRGEPLGQFRSEVLSDNMLVANSRAISRYKPKPYEGQTVLIVSDCGGSDLLDPRLQWKAFTSADCKVHSVPAPAHRCLMEQPWVRALAEDLRRTLEQKAPIGSIR